MNNAKSSLKQSPSKLDELRQEIDAIDDSISALFELRMSIAKEIARQKIELELSTYDPAREAEIIARLTEEQSLEQAARTKALYERVFELSRQVQDMDALLQTPQIPR